MENTNAQNGFAISRKSRSIGKYDTVIENDLFKCRVYWAKVIGSETESLFTQYTKHTFYEMQYALEGRIVMQIEKDKRIRIKQSEFIVLPPDTFHQIIDGDSVGARFIIAFSLEIKNARLYGLTREFAELIPYQETGYMRRLLEILIRKKDYGDEISRMQIASYLECFLLEIIEAAYPFGGYRTEGKSPLSEKELRVSQIQKFISSCSGIGIRPSDVAQKFNVCERHLNRIFVEITGKTVKEAINRQKLAKIEELAATTTLSFREISEFCGFSDEYAMSKFFKRYNYNGLTEYRELSRTKK